MLKQSLTTVALLSAGIVGAADKRPNLLFVFADEMRQQSLGFLKQDPVMTPNLDMFAKNSLFLPNTVSNLPVCSPFRASLLTGMYPHKTGSAEELSFFSAESFPET